MTILNTLKLFGMGILGGTLPLATYVIIQHNATNLSDQVIDGNRNAIHQVDFNGVPSGLDFTSAAENTVHSVVHITTKVVQTTFQRDPFQEFFYGPGAGGREFKQYGAGAGSGVIVSSQGYIVTNNHVIENASEIQVVLNDNSKYDAKVIGADPSTDIAVLKIEGENFPAIPIGNSDELKIGEWVLAVGNPFNLTSTVTAGIVSAKARNINLLSERSAQDVVPIESFIQTDAAVNPGNSGGALVNTRGELIGINTAIASQTGSYAGYSFAVPINLVDKVMRDLIDFGFVHRGFFGVQIADVTQDVKENNKLPDLKGVFLAKVTEGGSADKAGLKDGDVILKIGSKEVNSVASLQEEIGKRRPGDKVSLTVRQKDGDIISKELVLRNKDGDTELMSKEEISKNYALGATFIELTDKERKELNISYGVKIKSITTGKLKSIGLQEGIIITKVNNEPIETVTELTEKLSGVNRGILLEIMDDTGKRDYRGFGL
jgi:Do/DeqQ family serine protease